MAVVPLVLVRVGDLDLFIEARTVQQGGSEETSVVDRVTRTATDAFERAQHAIEEIAAMTAETLERTAQRRTAPEVVQVEFGLSVSAKGDVIVAGAAADASLKVTLTFTTKTTA